MHQCKLILASDLEFFHLGSMVCGILCKTDVFRHESFVGTQDFFLGREIVVWPAAVDKFVEVNALSYECDS